MNQHYYGTYEVKIAEVLYRIAIRKMNKIKCLKSAATSNLCEYTGSEIFELKILDN